MMVVFDSSTLILLGKINILREAAEQVDIVIPEKVREECLAKKSPDALLIGALIEERKIKIEKVASRKAIRKLCADFRIETAEAEAFYLAKKRGCPLAVDDGPTIKACKILGHKFVTAIHFLVDMAIREEINLTTALAKLEKLSMYGRYSTRIIQDAGVRMKGEV